MTGSRKRWERDLAQVRSDTRHPIVIQGHCLTDKMIPSGIENETVEDIVRTGSLVFEKCEIPDKLAFRKAPKGRGLKPIVVVARFRPTHIKVVTVYEEE